MCKEGHRYVAIHTAAVIAGTGEQMWLLCTVDASGHKDCKFTWVQVYAQAFQHQHAYSS